MDFIADFFDNIFTIFCFGDSFQICLVIYPQMNYN